LLMKTDALEHNKTQQTMCIPLSLLCKLFPHVSHVGKPTRIGKPMVNKCYNTFWHYVPLVPVKALCSVVSCQSISDNFYWVIVGHIHYCDLKKKKRFWKQDRNFKSCVSLGLIRRWNFNKGDFSWLHDNIYFLCKQKQ
jgi:hypothetical protein